MIKSVAVPVPIMDAVSIQKLLFYPCVEACIQKRLEFKKQFYISHHNYKLKQNLKVVRPFVAKLCPLDY